jgi:hypothetical protein
MLEASAQDLLRFCAAAYAAHRMTNKFYVRLKQGADNNKVFYQFHIKYAYCCHSRKRARRRVYLESIYHTFGYIVAGQQTCCVRGLTHDAPTAASRFSHADELWIPARAAYWLLGRNDKHNV